MVKPSSSSSQRETVRTQRPLSPVTSCEQQPSSSSDKKYKGVRKRKWGKYVSEIRLPNCRERIWLGSYDTAEKAARAFDAALYCLRGSGARFNFPDDPPHIENGRSMTPAEIQVAAARFAHSSAGGGGGEHSGRIENLDSGSDSVQSDTSDVMVNHHQLDSPSFASVSGGGAHQQLGFEMPQMPLDGGFSDQFCAAAGDNNVAELGLFPDFNEYTTGDDYIVPPLPGHDDYYYNNNNYYYNYNNNWQETNNYEELNTEGSSFDLWNF